MCLKYKFLYLRFKNLETVVGLTVVVEMVVTGLVSNNEKGKNKTLINI